MLTICAVFAIQTSSYHSFFTKKTYLVDLLEGFTDNHILPGIDDGAKTGKESVDL